MKELPILFCASIVRAILSGQKTVIRSAVKDDPVNVIALIDRDDKPKNKFGLCLTDHNVINKHSSCPYGTPGDRLWVRETWADANMDGAPVLAYRADGGIRDLMEEESFLNDRGAFNYDDPRSKPYQFCCWVDDLIAGAEARWRPPAHMPRWASRILLQITDVRVERLQDISEEQVIAEGIGLSICQQSLETPQTRHQSKLTAVHDFAGLWDSINGAGAWDSNPWVWVAEFKRVEP